MDTIATYKSYADKIENREKLYYTVQKEYHIQSALYPGSHIDIAPSFFIPRVTYVDNFKGTIKFFKDIIAIEKYIEENKAYSGESVIEFVAEDYTKLDLEKKYDLIISQYAGFVGQAVKSCLKKDGYLLCNDSHGDATRAYFDDAFELVAVINENYKITSLNLDQYFKLKNGKDVDIQEVISKMKGPKYMDQSENYIFQLK